MADIRAPRGERATVCAFVVAFLCLCGEICAQGQGASQIPGGLEEALQRNLESMQRVELSWEYRCQPLGEKAAVLRELNMPENENFFLPQRITLVFDFGRFYTETSASQVKLHDSGKPTNEIVQVVTERAFNLESYYNGRPNREQAEAFPMLLVKPAAQLAASKPSMPVLDAGYCEAAGYVFPTTAEALLRPQATSIPLELIQSERSSIRNVSRESGEDGSEVLILNVATPTGTHLLHFLPDQGFALQMYERRTPSGVLVSRSVCSDFIPLGTTTEVMLPSNIVVERATFETMRGEVADSPLFRQEYTLLQAKPADVPESRFVVDYSGVAGAFVTDATLPGADSAPGGAINYRVPADPADLESVIRGAREELQRTGRARWISLLVIINVAAVVLIALVLLIRKKSRQRQRQDAP